MDDLTIRQALDRAIRARGETYASVSRALGRNPTYVQQYIRRGVPRRLESDDRRAAARLLGLPETALGGDEATAQVHPTPAAALSAYDYVLVPGLDAGGDPLGFAFQAGWVRALASRGADRLVVVRMAGDSMQPTLHAGDQLLIDTADSLGRLRDGLYALRIGDEIIVKRLGVRPGARHVTVVSDNIAYPAWPGCDPAELGVIGRLVWAGRRFL